MKFRHRPAFCGILILMITLAAMPAMANHINTATVDATCSNYTISVSASALSEGKSYTISWTITLTPTAGGSPTTVSNSIKFTASSSTFSYTHSYPLGPLSADYTLSGTASLVGFNTIDISFSPSSLNCAPPPPPPCTASSTNGSNFNGTAIPAGDYIWFNANFTASGIPTNGVTITLTNSTISFTANGTKYNLQVPNAEITFSSSATCTSTTFDSQTNTWETTVPVSGDDEIFLSGLAWPVPSGGLPGGIQPVDWTGTFNVTTDTPGISLNWKWGAAVYSQFTTNYNSLGVKAGHQTACGASNGDHAGTPEGENSNNVPWKNFVVGGATGGGGSNWTGSWSGTVSVTPVCN